MNYMVFFGSSSGFGASWTTIGDAFSKTKGSENSTFFSPTFDGDLSLTFVGEPDLSAFKGESGGLTSDCCVFNLSFTGERPGEGFTSTEAWRSIDGGFLGEPDIYYKFKLNNGLCESLRKHTL